MPNLSGFSELTKPNKMRKKICEEGNSHVEIAGHCIHVHVESKGITALSSQHAGATFPVPGRITRNPEWYLKMSALENGNLPQKTATNCTGHAELPTDDDRI